MFVVVFFLCVCVCVCVRGCVCVCVWVVGWLVGWLVRWLFSGGMGLLSIITWGGAVVGENSSKLETSKLLKANNVCSMLKKLQSEKVVQTIFEPDHNMP